jgi:hypothetical protein
MVASKIDPTVFLVGNATNVFKQYFLNGKINKTGHIIIQPAINSKYLPDPNSCDIKKFSSTYTSFGVLANYSDLEKIIHDTYEFFTKIIPLNPDLLTIEISDLDKDLLNSTTSIPGVNIQDNTRSKNNFGAYKNVPINGRNMRFCYNNQNISVLSVYEYDGTRLGVEAATTLEILLTEKYNLQNTMQTSVLNAMQNAQNGFDLKYYDCITAISELIVSGVYPNSSHMDGRILKKYLNTLNILEQKCNKTQTDSAELVDFYLDTFYKNIDFASNIKRVMMR